MLLNAAVIAAHHWIPSHYVLAQFGAGGSQTIHSLPSLAPLDPPLDPFLVSNLYSSTLTLAINGILSPSPSPQPIYIYPAFALHGNVFPLDDEFDLHVLYLDGSLPLLASPSLPITIPQKTANSAYEPSLQPPFCLYQLKIPLMS
jgi:hypothetical protein